MGGFATDNASAFTAGAGYTAATSGSAGTTSVVGLHGEWKLVGAYNATATKATAGGWTSGLVSYRALSTVPDTTAPTAPGTPTVAVSPTTECTAPA